MTRFLFPEGAGSVFTTESETALGPTQTPIKWVTGPFFPRKKQPRREADRSTAPNAEVKMRVTIHILPYT